MTVSPVAVGPVAFTDAAARTTRTGAEWAAFGVLTAAVAEAIATAVAVSVIAVVVVVVAVVMVSLVDVGEAMGVLALAVGVTLLVVAAVRVTLLVAVALTLGDEIGVPDAVVVSATVDGALALEPLFTATTRCVMPAA